MPSSYSSVFGPVLSALSTKTSIEKKCLNRFNYRDNSLDLPFNCQSKCHSKQKHRQHPTPQHSATSTVLRYPFLRFTTKNLQQPADPVSPPPFLNAWISPLLVCSSATATVLSVVEVTKQYYSELQADASGTARCLHAPRCTYLNASQYGGWGPVLPIRRHYYWSDCCGS